MQSYGQIPKPTNNRCSFRALQTTVFQAFDNNKLHSALFSLFLLPETSIFAVEDNKKKNQDENKNRYKEICIIHGQDILYIHIRVRSRSLRPSIHSYWSL